MNTRPDLTEDDIIGMFNDCVRRGGSLQITHRVFEWVTSVLVSSGLQFKVGWFRGGHRRITPLVYEFESMGGAGI